MNYCEDYYEILQVHHMAEPEIISSAYRRLAKKYHPDVSKNKTSGAIMQKINEAYRILKEPDSRRQYHKKWMKRHIVKDKNHRTKVKAQDWDEKKIYSAKGSLRTTLITY